MSETVSGSDEKHRSRDRLPRRTVLRAAVGGAAALTGAGEASAGGRQPCDPDACDVPWDRRLVRGSPGCHDLGFRTAAEIEPPRSATYHFRVDGERHSVTLRVVERSGEPVLVTFCSDVSFERVVVKGGPNANVYEPRTQPATCGAWLHPPVDPKSGKLPAISHVDLCFGEARKKPKKERERTEPKKERERKKKDREKKQEMERERKKEPKKERERKEPKKDREKKEKRRRKHRKEREKRRRKHRKEREKRRRKHRKERRKHEKQRNERKKQRKHRKERRKHRKERRKHGKRKKRGETRKKHRKEREERDDHRDDDDDHRDDDDDDRETIEHPATDVPRGDRGGGRPPSRGHPTTGTAGRPASISRRAAQVRSPRRIARLTRWRHVAAIPPGAENRLEVPVGTSLAAEP